MRHVRRASSADSLFSARVGSLYVLGKQFSHSRRLCLDKYLRDTSANNEGISCAGGGRLSFLREKLKREREDFLKCNQ